MSLSSSLLLLAKTIIHPAVRSLCDSWASCTCNHCTEFYRSAITEVCLLCCIRQSLWSTAVYSIFVYRICQSFNVSQHSLWNCCVQSETSTNSSVFGRLFLRFKVTFRLENSAFCSNCPVMFFTQWRQKWATLSTRHSRCRHGVTHVGTSPRHCLRPPHSTACRSPTKLCLAGLALIVESAGEVVVTRQFRWWSLVLTGLSYRLLISLLSAWVPWLWVVI